MKGTIFPSIPFQKIQNANVQFKSTSRNAFLFIIKKKRKEKKRSMILFYVYFPCNYLCCMIGTYYLPFPMREVQPASPLGMAIGWGRSKRWGVHPYLA